MSSCESCGTVLRPAEDATDIKAKDITEKKALNPKTKTLTGDGCCCSKESCGTEKEHHVKSRSGSRQRRRHDYSSFSDSSNCSTTDCSSSDDSSSTDCSSSDYSTSSDCSSSEWSTTDTDSSTHDEYDSTTDSFTDDSYSRRRYYKGACKR